MKKRFNFKTTEDVVNKMSELLGGNNSLATYGTGTATMQKSIMHQAALWKKYTDEILVHANGYLLPKILQLRPNENAESMKNRLLQYEPFTTSHWSEAITRIQRVISASSVDVKYSEKTADYVKTPNFDGLSLFDFFALNICEKTINCPNGLIVIYPIDYATEKEINPIQFISEKEIIYLDTDTAVFVSNLDSEYTTTYNEPKAVQEISNLWEIGRTYNLEPTITYTNPVYHVFTKADFGVIQLKDGGEYTGVAQNTGLGFLPVVQFGGEKVADFVYKSFLHNAVHYGNTALNRASDDNAVQSMYSYPIVEMSSQTCNTCDGRGTVRNKSTKGNGESFEDATCQTCGGSGETIIRSPYKVMLRKRAKSNTEPLDSGIDSVRFYSPDIGILTHSATNWQDYENKYKRALYLIDRKDTASAESGASLEKQFEPLYDFLHKIGLTLFGNLEVIIKAIQGYIDPQEAPPTVTRPISYHLIEESEAFTVLGEFLSNATPLYLRRQYIKNFISKYIGINSPILEIIEVLEVLDPFFYYSLDEKTKTYQAGGMTQKQFVLSVASFGVMREVHENYEMKTHTDDDTAGKKGKKPKEQTKAEIMDAIKAIIDKWELAPPPNILPPTGSPKA